MSATDFGDVVTAAGLAVPSTIVLVAGVDESPVPSVAMNAPSARRRRRRPRRRVPLRVMHACSWEDSSDGAEGHACV